MSNDKRQILDDVGYIEEKPKKQKLQITEEEKKRQLLKNKIKSRQVYNKW